MLLYLQKFKSSASSLEKGNRVIMITTIFLLLLLSFEIWYLTSKQYKQVHPPVYYPIVLANAKQFRMGTTILLLISAVLLVIKLGLMAGLFALVVAFMAAGSLIITLQPLRYIRFSTIAALYSVVLLLEIFL